MQGDYPTVLMENSPGSTDCTAGGQAEKEDDAGEEHQLPSTEIWSDARRCVTVRAFGQRVVDEVEEELLITVGTGNTNGPRGGVPSLIASKIAATYRNDPLTTRQYYF